MKAHLTRRIPMRVAMGVVLAMLALGFLGVVGVRFLVVETASADPAKPNPGHSWSEVELPAGTWPGLNADTLDGLDSTLFAQKGQCWMTTGNDSISSPDNVLGTMDNVPLVIETDGLPAMFIDNIIAGVHGQNVGIGTTNPQELLDISPVEGGYTDLGIRLDPNNDDFSGGTAWQMDNDDGDFKIVEDATCAPEFVNNPRIVAVGNCTGSPYGGNVGIGTDSPTAQLHVIAGGALGKTAVLGDGDTGVAGIGSEAGVVGRAAWKGVVGIGGLWAGYFEGNGYFSGNVGIGTTTPQAMLDVAGDVALGTGAGSQATWVGGAPVGPTNADLRILSQSWWYSLAVGNQNNTEEYFTVKSGTGNGYFKGNVGIGTNSPQATLDVNGYARLAKYSDEPVACGLGNDGSIALTSKYTLCVCNGIAGPPVWVETSTGGGTTSCNWGP